MWSESEALSSKLLSITVDENHICFSNNFKITGRKLTGFVLTNFIRNPFLYIGTTVRTIYGLIYNVTDRWQR